MTALGCFAIAMLFVGYLAGGWWGVFLALVLIAFIVMWLGAD